MRFRHSIASGYFLVATCVFLVACSKGDSPATNTPPIDTPTVEGTYRGSVHNWGSYSRVMPGGAIDSGSWDTTYAAEIALSLIGDSIRFSYPAGGHYTFLRNNDDEYCDACAGNTIHSFVLKPSKDSLTIYRRLSGGGGLSHNYNNWYFELKKQ